MLGRASNRSRKDESNSNPMLDCTQILNSNFERLEKVRCSWLQEHNPRVLATSISSASVSTVYKHASNDHCHSSYAREANINSNPAASSDSSRHIAETRHDSRFIARPDVPRIQKGNIATQYWSLFSINHHDFFGLNYCYQVGSILASAILVQILSGI